MNEYPDEVPLIAAARILGWKYARVYSALCDGTLDGRQGENGRWRVTLHSVAELKAQDDARRPDTPTPSLPK